MDVSTVILIVVVALALGAGLGFVVGRQRGAAEAANRAGAAEQQSRAAEQLALSDARQESARAWQEAARVREEAATAKAAMAGQAAAQAELRAELAEAERRLAEGRSREAGGSAEVAAVAAQRDAALERAKQLAADREALLDRFKVLSAESLERQGKQADEAAAARFQATEKLVAPLADGLKQLQQKLVDVEKDRVRMAAELGEQVQAVRISGDAIRRETLSLSNALRTPQVRGAWGEQSLKRIVEISGLTERCDFDAQHTYTSDEGRFRPDMRINLPGGKVIFVDSKVPLSAALEAYNTEDETAQKAHFKTFAAHVRKHIDDLSGKSYWSLDLGSPEFVMLYLPSDEFYRLALEQDPALHEYAARRQIVLASPGLLIPQLQVVASSWQRVAIAETAAEVSRLGQELYARLSTLGGHFDKLGKAIGSAVTHYNKAVGAVESRVMVTARKFKDMGIVSESLDEPPMVATESPREIAVPEMQQYEELRQLDQAAFDAVTPADDPLGEAQVRELRRRTGASEG